MSTRKVAQFGIAEGSDKAASGATIPEVHPQEGAPAAAARRVRDHNEGMTRALVPLTVARPASPKGAGLQGDLSRDQERGP